MTAGGALMVNGRFLTRPLSGVDRVAVELTRALSRRIGEGRALSLAVPADVTDAQLAALGDVRFTAIHRGRSRGQRWEQAELPRVAGPATLLNLCNIGPLVRRDQLVLIHDAQVLLEPSSYSRAFRAWYRLAQPILARRSRAIATISHYSREQLERFGVATAGKLAIIPNGVDHLVTIPPDATTLPRYALAPDGYVLALGNLAPHKNLAMLMRAAAARPAGSPELVIAGGGNARVFQDAGLVPPAGVRLLGRVTDAELRALYAHARLFVFPSLTEGFGLPPLEAMACGCPVIATNAAAVPEVCGDAAWLVDPRDQGAWTAAMTTLAGDDERRRVLASAGLARSALYTWDAAAAKLLALIDEAKV